MEYNIEYKIEEIYNGVTSRHYLINGIRVKITPEMIQDLNGPFGKGVQEHIIDMYHKEIVVIRDRKLSSLLDL